MPAQQVVWNRCGHARKPADINLRGSRRGQASLGSNSRPQRARKWDQQEGCAPTTVSASAVAQAPGKTSPPTTCAPGHPALSSRNTRGSLPGQWGAGTWDLLRRSLGLRFQASSGPMAPSSTRRFPDPFLEISMRKGRRMVESRCGAAASSLLGGQTAPEPRLLGYQELGGPPGLHLRLHPGSPEPWEQAAAEGAHARLRPGSLPSRQSLGKVWRGLLWQRRTSQRLCCPG